MTDEELADLKELVRDVLRENQREQTAATILAALIQAHATANAQNPEACADLPGEYRDSAVLMADALRTALKVPQ